MIMSELFNSGSNIFTEYINLVVIEINKWYKTDNKIKPRKRKKVSFLEKPNNFEYDYYDEYILQRAKKIIQSVEKVKEKESDEDYGFFVYFD